MKNKGAVVDGDSGNSSLVEVDTAPNQFVKFTNPMYLQHKKQVDN